MTEMTMVNHTEASSDMGTGTEVEDTIYCEAGCRSEDVFYQGSEDEDYDDSSTRRKRYEAAGQRFLNGNVPLLLSAALRGPFDKESGWLNPWRSKNRTSNMSQTAATSTPSLEPRSAPSHHSPPIKVENIDETHLPSPESLKQAPFTEPHPFLEQKELALVHKWRKTVVPSSAATSIVQSLESGAEASPNKRKRDGSSWLKGDAIKKRRIGSISRDHTDRAVSRSRTLPLDLNRGSPRRVPSVLNGSFHSLPEGLGCAGSDKAQTDAGESDGDDELNAISASFQSASASPSRRKSPRRKFGQATGYHSQVSDDELSPTKRATATLSSPISQKGKAQACRDRMKASRIKSITESPTRIKERGSSTLSNVASSSLSLSDIDMMDTKGEESSEEERVLEAQEDSNFANKVVRPKPHDCNNSNNEANPASHDTNESEESSSTPSAQQGIIEGVTSNPHTSEEADNVEDASYQNIPGVKSATNSKPNLEIDEQEVAIDNPNDDCTEDEEELMSQQLNMAINAIDEQTQGGSNSQISLVERPALRKQDTAFPMNDRAAQPVSMDNVVLESQSTTISECHDVVAEQPRPSQEKEAAGFSLKSIFNRCVTPLRRLSGLSVQPNFRSELGVSTGASNVDLVESTCDNKAQGKGDVEPLQEPEGEVKDINAGNGAQPLAESTKEECPQSPSNDSQPPASSPSVVHSGSTAANSDLNHSSTPETLQKTLSLSQQSPWIDTLPPQDAQMDNATPTNEAHKHIGNEAATVTPAVPLEAQSPWISDAKSLFNPKGQRQSFENADASPCPGKTTVGVANSVLNDVESKSRSPTQAEPARPSTPEPQFAVTAFSSFMTPSPERRSRRQKREAGSQLPNTQNILGSVMKNPWRSSTSTKRVSWASLPQEQESPCRVNRLSSRDGLQKRERPGSPPPTTSLSNMAMSDDMRFRKHFTAVANRSRGITSRILPTESQQMLYSPGPQAMAEKFLAADDAAMPEPMDTMMLGESNALMELELLEQGEQEKLEEHEEQEEQEEPVDPIDSTDPADDTQEPMDMVEDIFNEMGDFLQGWDVDAKLDEARKTDKLGSTPGLGIEAQSP